MTDDKPKKFRSPPYPALTLERAIDRAQQLYAAAQHFEVGVSVLASAWEYGEKSSGLWATAAALIHYGLLSDNGTGKARKFKLTDIAHRIIRDADPKSEKRISAIQRAAKTPKIHFELFEQFGPASDLADAVLINSLTLDRRDAGDAPYSDEAAKDVVRIYRDTINFSGLSESASISENSQGKSRADTTENDDESLPKIEVGQYIQWTSGSIDQFKLPRRVEWISDDGTHLRVHGSPTGIPMNEVTVTAAPAPPAPSKLTAKPGSAVTDGETPTGSKSDISVYQTGNRLQITADVDAEGIKKLKEMLGKYEDILALLK